MAFIPCVLKKFIEDEGKSMRKIEDISNIHCVAYVHADHAWTNSRQWHIKRYIEGMNRVLDYMQVNPDYTFMIDNVLHYYAVIERYLPERVEEVKQRVKEGRIHIVNGGMALTRAYNYGDELYLRNVIAGREALQERFPEADIFLFFNADTGVGHSQLPQILTQTGHSHYRFFRPENALDHSGVPREFIWKGLDGTGIVATRGYYGSFMEARCCDSGLLHWEDRKEAFIKEELEARLPYTESNELFLNIGSDDTYPQRNVCDRESDITGFMEQWSKHEKSKMFYSTPRKYHEALTAHPLPIWEGICDPVELFYNTPIRSNLALTRLRFTTEQLLLLTERLQVIFAQIGGQPDTGLLKELWDVLFMYSGHAMQFLLEEDYDEMLELADITIAKAKRYIRELKQQIAQKAGGDLPNTYVVINPEPYTRKETIELLVTTPEHIKGLQLVNQNGVTIPYQIIDGYEGDKPYVNKDYNEVVVAFTVELPPMGVYRIYAVNTQADMMLQAEKDVFLWSQPIDPKESVEIDNGRYCFTVSNGVITQIVDKINRVCSPVTGNFGQLRFYKTNAQTASGTTWCSWEQDDLYAFIPQKMRYLQRGPEKWKLRISGTLYGLDAVIMITTSKNSPTIHYNIHFDCRGEEGYFAVSFPSDDNPQILAGIPFGTERRDLSSVRYSEDFKIPKDDYLYYERECKGGFCANRFTSFVQNQKRVVLTQGDAAYLYRHNEDKKEIETFLMRSIDVEQREKLWMRNIHPSQSGVGRHDFSFAVSFVDMDASIAVLEKLVSRDRFPVITAPLYGKREQLPSNTDSLFQSMPENLTVTACMIEDDHIVLRLYENSGLGYSGALNIHKNLCRADVCDLLGRTQCQMQTDGSAIQLEIRPWQIANIRLWLQ